MQPLTLVSSCRSILGSFHSWQCLRNSPEEVLYVVSNLCTRFNEHKIVLLGLFLSLLCRYLALIVQIRLVANQYNNNIVSSLAAYIIDPFPCVLEGLRICIASGANSTARIETHLT